MSREPVSDGAKLYAHKTKNMNPRTADWTATPAEAQAHWYVACTMPRHEKQVALQLGGKNVEYFLPLYATKSRWKDRTARVELPLFPGYVFVHIPLEKRLQVLTVPSIHRLVSFNGPPLALHDEEVERLRGGLDRVKAEPHPFLKAGQTVRIKHGPLSGAEGVLLRGKENFRVVLSMDMLMQSVAVEVDLADLDMN